MLAREVRKAMKGIPQDAEMIVSPDGWGWWRITSVDTDYTQPGGYAFVACQPMPGATVDELIALREGMGLRSPVPGVAKKRTRTKGVA